MYVWRASRNSRHLFFSFDGHFSNVFQKGLEQRHQEKQLNVIQELVHLVKILQQRLGRFIRQPMLVVATQGEPVEVS